MSQNADDNLDLRYPCVWGYRIIAASEGAVRKAVAAIVGEAEHSLTASNTSKTGRYLSFNLELTVHDEDHRKSILAALQNVQEIKYVL